MTHSVTRPTQNDVPAPPGDSENPALIDAEKTFRATVIGALIFVLSAVFIIMRTRMG